MWTFFHDMSGGGTRKVPPLRYIFIEASEGKAIRVFQELFDVDPEKTTCQHCGQDYALTKYRSLTRAVRHLSDVPLSDAKVTMGQFLEREDVKVVFESEWRMKCPSVK